MGFFEKLRAGLRKTKDSMMGKIEGLLNSFTKIDEDLFEELEETLIMCDIGVNTSVKIELLIGAVIKLEKSVTLKVTSIPKGRLPCVNGKLLVALFILMDVIIPNCIFCTP